MIEDQELSSGNGMERCRACLRIQNNFKPLFNNPELIDKIETISGIKLTQDPNFPESICTNCIENVNKLYNFRKVIINSDRELKERLAITIKDEIVICEPPDVLKEESYNHEEIDSNAEEVQNIGDRDPLDLGETTDSNCEDVDSFLEYKCKDCHESFATRKDLMQHKKTTHIRKGICNICGVEVRKDNLSKHIQTHSSSSAECTKCGRRFKNSQSLRVHMFVHKDTIYTCEICGMQIKVKSEYTRHVKTHTESNQITITDEGRGHTNCCVPGCKSTYKRNKNLSFHRFPKFGQIVTIYDKFGNAEMYDLRELWEVRIKKGKRVSNTMKVCSLHFKEEDYECSDPDRRKVTCKVCGKKVVCMKRHLISHTGERPNICKYCQKGFTSEYALEVHIRQHTNERPFKCEVCNAGFTQKISLKTHLKSKHKIVK